MRCELLTGRAGTGKTTELQRRISEEGSYGLLTASTGIAAVNLGSKVDGGGVSTINSALGFFDAESMADAYFRGQLTARLAKLANVYRNLLIDEVSMLHGEVLDILFQAIDEVNDYETVRHPLGIVLSGDFCQLCPINGKWAFQAECWPEFAKHVTRLDKAWRQEDPEFLRAINCVRQGQGHDAAEELRPLVDWAVSVDNAFDGTTIFGLNAQVDRFNWLAHQRVNGRPFTAKSSRWGQQRSEWRHIPEELTLKVGALVMCLSNDYPEFSFANGDCGHLVDATPVSDCGAKNAEEKGSGNFVVRLFRTGQEVEIPQITRRLEVRDEPAEKPEGSFYDKKTGRWVLGGITYHPLRLAYAATVHKTQGLTLDRVQIDPRGRFFGEPAMMYVALSRCRTKEGVRIVGTPELFAERVKVHPEVLEWL